MFNLCLFQRFSKNNSILDEVLIKATYYGHSIKKHVEGEGIALKPKS